MLRTVPIACGLLLAGAACASAAPLRILPLGDSITHGITSRGADGGYSYRYLLWRQFVDAGREVDFVGSLNTPYDSPLAYPPYQGQTFDPDHEGHYGWSSRMVDESLPSWLATYDVDVALIHLGHNDYWREIAPSGGAYSYADVENHLTSIIESLQADNPRVIVLLAQVVASNPNQPPEGGSFPAAHIDALNALVPTIAAATAMASSPVIVVDQHTDFDPLVMIYDGVHTNALGEQHMANVWLQAITANATPAGDFNGDGDVDAADLAQWRGDFGLNGQSDADNDGDSDGADFLVWQRQLGGGLPAQGAAVPEPAASVLIAAPTLFLALARRGRPR